jgi:hypothetical protein
LVAQASSTIRRKQKALIEMNIQLSNVLSDLSGVSGMAIVQAILAGKRDPRELAALADPQVKASMEVIAKSLYGNWREELLFVLRQEVDIYLHVRSELALVIGNCGNICNASARRWTSLPNRSVPGQRGNGRAALSKRLTCAGN